MCDGLAYRRQLSFSVVDLDVAVNNPLPQQARFLLNILFSSGLVFLNSLSHKRKLEQPVLDIDRRSVCIHLVERPGVWVKMVKRLVSRLDQNGGRLLTQLTFSCRVCREKIQR